MTQRVHLVDPTAPPPAVVVSPAPRPRTLDGAVIGLVHNTKTHGMTLMRMVVDNLRHRYDIADVRTTVKSPAQEDRNLGLWAQHNMAVIAAIGD